MRNDDATPRIRTLRAPPPAPEPADLEAVDPREFALEAGAPAARPGPAPDRPAGADALPDWRDLRAALRAVEQEAEACRARTEAAAREAHARADRLAAELEEARRALHDAEHRVAETDELRRRLREALG